jgi:hypothetical protein
MGVAANPAVLAAFGIVAAMAALILLPEFIIRAWDRKRIQRCQRQGMAR